MTESEQTLFFAALRALVILLRNAQKITKDLEKLTKTGGEPKGDEE